MKQSKAIDWNDYYTGEQAAAALTRNSGKTISADYLRSLVRDGKITCKKLGHNNMYPKREVDAYVVGARGDTLKRERKQVKPTD